MSTRSIARRLGATTAAAFGLIAAGLILPGGAASALEPCPPGQTPFWNGKNCVMQLCAPPYNPTFPPCTMPAPTAAPAPAPTAPGAIPGTPF